MQLKEIVGELLEKKFHSSTRELARALDIGEMDVRRIAGFDPGSRRNQEKIFQVSLKIMRLCNEMGIDPAQELKMPSDEEVLNAIQSPGPTTRGNAKKRKKGHEAPITSLISARRIGGSRGKIR
jgi:hypothetical protein